LLFGIHKATLVERQTRYVLLVKVVGKDTETVVNALSRMLASCSMNSEMAGHKRFTLVTDIQVYFRDPQNPWQRERARLSVAV